MTAMGETAYKVLARISSGCIGNSGINRVVTTLALSPPSTIEWE